MFPRLLTKKIPYCTCLLLLCFGTAFSLSAQPPNKKDNKVVSPSQIFNVQVLEKETPIRDYIFNDPVMFDGKVIKEQFSVYDCSFNSLFKAPLNEYIKDVFFFENDFSKRATFNLSLFRSELTIRGCSFMSEAFFTKTVFEKKAEFREVNFNSETDFSGVEINTSLDFNKCKFGEEYYNFNRINFDGIICKGILRFSETKFKGNKPLFSFRNNKIARLEFENCDFDNPGFLSSISLPDTLVLLDNRIGRVDSVLFDLRAIEKKKDGKKCVLITNIAGTALLVPHDKFDVIFPDKYYSEESRTLFYEAQVKQFTDRRNFESAREWDIGLRKFQTGKKWGWAAAILHNFNKIWWNYGYDKWRILFIFLPVLYIFFSMVNFFLLPRMLRYLYFDPSLEEKSIGGNAVDVEGLLEYFRGNPYFRFKYTLHYTGLIYFGFKIKHEGLTFRRLWLVFYFYFIYLCGLLHIAFSINFIFSK